MYINRLIEFAEANEDKFPPIGYKQKKINWYVYLNEKDADFIPVDIELTVPDAPRSSDIKPILIVDKPEYVFGMYEKDQDKKRSEERHRAYKDLLDQCIAETNDESVKRLRKFLDQPVTLPDGMKINDFIVFCINDEEFLHDAPNVKRFWSEFVQPKKDKKSTVSLCMFCHEEKLVMDRHTINFLIGNERTKLISANKNAYDSHGLKNSLSAPTCYVCEQKYGKALSYMLQRYNDRSGGPHTFRVGDITYVYWIRKGKDKQIDLNPFMSPRDDQSEQDMKDLLMQTFKGVEKERELKNFCLLAFTSNKARLVIRDYVEDSLGNIEKRIKAFFDAQNIGGKRYYGVYALAATMYSEPKNQMQKYALKEWVDWFLYGRRLSGRILLPILKRIQAEGVMYPQHAAAIQSWLVSQREGGMNKMELEEREGYKIGKIFAILEKIQREAIPTENTIASKFFGSASTTPNAVMGLLIRNAQHHLSKIRNAGPHKKMTANRLEKDLAYAISEINEFPKMLNLSGQGEFAIGYYHELHNRRSVRKDKEENAQ